MKIIVTGPLGHIGSKLIRDLAVDFNQAEIILLDNLLTQRYCSLFNLPKCAKYTFYNKDILTFDFDTILSKADVLIHLAAITDAASSFEKQQEIEEVNFKGTRIVAEACARNNVPMIFLSTTSVYGTQKDIVDENCSADELKPQSPYADSKFRSEILLKEMSEKNKLKFIICRFGTIYGTSPGMRFHTAINKFCWQAIMGESVTVWKTALHQVRPYLDLKDAIRALSFIIKNKIFDNDVYNVLTLNASVNDIIEVIKKKVPTLKIELVDAKIMNQLSYHVKCEKFAKLGFQFQGNLEVGVSETLSLIETINEEIR